MTAISRRSLVASFHKARRDRDRAIRLAAEYRAAWEEMCQAYGRLVNELESLRVDVGKVKELSVRKHLLFAAADAERDITSPLQ
jgi:hypothetical protein